MIRFVQTSQTFNMNILNENLNLDINLSLNVILVSKLAFWSRFKLTFWLQTWTLIWVVITVRVLTICFKKSPLASSASSLFLKMNMKYCIFDMWPSWLFILFREIVWREVGSSYLFFLCKCCYFCIFFAIVWWCVFVDFSILFSSVCLCTITHNMLLFWLMSAFECFACIIFKYNLNGISSCSLLSDAAQQTTANYTTNFFFNPNSCCSSSVRFRSWSCCCAN